MLSATFHDTYLVCRKGKHVDQHPLVVIQDVPFLILLSEQPCLRDDDHHHIKCVVRFDWLARKGDIHHDVHSLLLEYMKTIVLDAKSSSSDPCFFYFNFICLPKFIAEIHECFFKSVVGVADQDVAVPLAMLDQH